MRRALAVTALVAFPVPALAICRLVTERGSAPPEIDAAQSVLVVVRHDLVIDDCPDAGPAGDAGTCAPRLADATTLVVQPSFRTDAAGSRFAFLMVTPRAPRVSLYDRHIFWSLAQRTKPAANVVEVKIEDPSLGYQCRDPKYAGGCNSDFSYSDQPPAPPPPAPASSGDAGSPGEIEPALVGDYAVAVLGGLGREALQGWLDDHDYLYTAADLDAAGRYVARGYHVIAVRIAVDHRVDGALAPLAFTYEGDDLTIPVGIAGDPGIGNGAPLVVFVAADARYLLPGGTLRYAQPITAVGGTFYLTRSDLWTELDGQTPDPVPVRVDGQAVRETYEVRREVRIPSSECPQVAAEDSDRSGCDCRLGRRDRSLPMIGLLAVAGFILSRLRRRR